MGWQGHVGRGIPSYQDISDYGKVEVMGGGGKKSKLAETSEGGEYGGGFREFVQNSNDRPDTGRSTCGKWIQSN